MKLLFFALLLASSWAGPSVRDGESCGVLNAPIELNMEENSAAFWFSQTEAQDKIASEDLEEELKGNGFENAWTAAKNKWNGTLPPKGLRKEHMIAVSYYTHSGGKYALFNKEIAKYGDISTYNENFSYKSSQYLLTVALQRLKTGSNQSLVSRGTKQPHSGKKGKEMRFGKFASTSLRSSVASGFGTGTFFQLNTTYGALIAEYSFNETHKEVLVPPYEKFEIVSAEGSGGRCKFKLRSRGYEGVEVELERDASGRLRVHLKGLPWWAWLLIAIAILVALTGAGGSIYYFCCQD
ncbi:NAD(P)(+)--arginine ADP-ribosyltransferase 2-like [Mustelus asterias]